MCVCAYVRMLLPAGSKIQVPITKQKLLITKRSLVNSGC